MYRNVGAVGFDTVGYKLRSLGAVSAGLPPVRSDRPLESEDCIRLYPGCLKLHRHSKGCRPRHIGDTCRWLSWSHNPFDRRDR